ncbi:MAG: substrate-binding domain-containing protein, partial [Collinsella sp.]
EAGVSPATVSRYLNNRPGQMTEETRARIAAVIERTGYRPRAAARNLRSSRTNLIGVILADIANPFSSAMLEGLSASAAARGCSLMTAISGNDPAKEAESLTRLIDAGVDGLVVNTCGGNDEAIAAAAGRLPVVLLDRDVAAGGVDLVTSNNRELVAGLVDALAAAGSERLCLLTEASDDSPVRRERAEAFTDELSRRGLAGEVVTLADGGATGVGRLDETIRGYAGKKLGLIAVNGLVFLRLTEALAQLGPSLPAGLKIATFDDYPEPCALWRCDHGRAGHPHHRRARGRAPVRAHRRCYHHRGRSRKAGTQTHRDPRPHRTPRIDLALAARSQLPVRTRFLSA